mmetsp:Transcript_19368/g.36163  ORF Transcript_19368/g.36163 Transcript_19368/m.36163 type:complete len:215 (+) Transcript_19368:1877-2521(+)
METDKSKHNISVQCHFRHFAFLLRPTLFVKVFNHGWFRNSNCTILNCRFIRCNHILHFNTHRTYGQSMFGIEFVCRVDIISRKGKRCRHFHFGSSTTCFGAFVRRTSPLHTPAQGSSDQKSQTLAGLPLISSRNVLQATFQTVRDANVIPSRQRTPTSDGHAQRQLEAFGRHQGIACVEFHVVEAERAKCLSTFEGLFAEVLFAIGEGGDGGLP